jgi:hypothetical protein
MRNSLKMDVLDELRLFREKRLSNSTFCATVSYSNLNLNLNLNLKLESETVERIVGNKHCWGGGGGGGVGGGGGGGGGGGVPLRALCTCNILNFHFNLKATIFTGCRRVNM